MTVPVYAPNSELVAVAWLKTLDGIPVAAVGTTLPDLNAWHTTGFVQVAGVVGGSPDLYVPLRNPVIQVDCWAAKLNSERPPWGQANTLAENVLKGCYATPEGITLRDEYFTAKVFEVSAVTEPRRIPEDPGSFARYTVDLLVHWEQTEE